MYTYVIYNNYNELLIKLSILICIQIHIPNILTMYN